MPPSMALSLAIAPTRHSPSPAWRHLSPWVPCCPANHRIPVPWAHTPLVQACVAASLSVVVLQILSAAVQFGSSLWSSPLSAPMIFSFQANQGSWGLYW